MLDALCVWPRPGTSFPLAKLCKLSLGPMICLSKLDPVVYLSLSLKPRSKQFPWQGVPAWGWVPLRVTGDAKRRWRLPLCVVEVVYEEKHTTARPGRANCAISLAWLGFGGITLFKGRETTTCVLHPCPLLELRKAMQRDGCFCCRAMRSPIANPTAWDGLRSQSIQKKLKLQCCESSFRKEKRRNGSRRIFIIPSSSFSVWTCAKHIWPKRGEMWFPQDETSNGYKQFLRRPAL